MNLLYSQATGRLTNSLILSYNPSVLRRQLLGHSHADHTSPLNSLRDLTPVHTSGSETSSRLADPSLQWAVAPRDSLSLFHSLSLSLYGRRAFKGP